jgi:hypothetical protein
MTAITRPYYVRIANAKRGYRGLGQCDPTVATCIGTGGEAVDVQEGGTYVPPSPAQQIYFPSTTTSTAGSGGGTTSQQTNPWASLLSTLVTTAGKTAQTALSPFSALPAGTYYATGPGGTVVSTAGTASAAAAQLTSYLPIILIGGGLLVVVMMMGKK